MNILKKLGIVIMGALLGESHGAAKNFSYVDMNEVVNNIKVILWQDVNSSKVLDQAKKWKKSIREMVVGLIWIIKINQGLLGLHSNI